MLLAACYCIATPPHEIIQSNLAFIIDAVSGSGRNTIIEFSNNLLQQRLISKADHDAVLYPSGLSPVEIVSKLIVPIMSKIKFVPKKYEVFLQVLDKVNLDFVVEMLKELS